MKKHLYSKIFDFAELADRPISRTDIVRFICALHGKTYQTADIHLPNGCRITRDTGRYSSMFYHKTLEHAHNDDPRYFVRDPKTKLFTLVKTH